MAVILDNCACIHDDHQKGGDVKYRRLGKAGTKVSVVGLGAWLTFGGSVGDKTAEESIYAAVDSGVNFIDVADAYAGGEAERVVGKAIRNLNRNDLVISSKLYWPMSDNVNDRGLSRKHILASVEGSLRRLGTDYLDIYFCHRYDEETPLEETVRAMDDLVHQGKILYWGTSVWEPEQIGNAVEIARQFNAYPPQVEQPRYNLFDRHIEPEIMPTCARYGIGLTVFSPLAQGLLTGKYNNGIPGDSRAETHEWMADEITEGKLSKVRQLMSIAEELGVTSPQLALAWVLRRPEVSAVITGASRPEHVKNNVKAAEITLDADVLDRIDKIF
jgi:voltage-dependent potassium channel beta subunit